MNLHWILINLCRSDSLNLTIKLIQTVEEATELPYLNQIIISKTSAWWTMDRGSWHCTGDRDQDHPHGKEMQESKMAVWGGLTNICEKQRSEKQRRKGKIEAFECRVSKNSKKR